MTIVIPRWMRLAFVVFGLIAIADGIRTLLGDSSAGWGWVQLALGVGWLLMAAFKGRRRLV